MNEESSNQERLALSLLIGQTLFYGMAQSAIAVAAYTVFLDTFGAQMLPYGYLVTAVSIALAFYGVTWLQRCMAIPRMLTLVMSSLAAIATLLWLLLLSAEVKWIAFALLPLTTFVFQWGFILPGLQVGRIFNVRQVKRLYPIVNAGLTIGFVLGSVGAPMLVARTGLLASAMAGAVVMILLSSLLTFSTTSIFKDRFTQPSSDGQPPTPKPLGQLLRQRYIRLIIVVQMLTTVVWHIVEFMYLAQSEARYPVAEELAAFIGGFGAARNIVAVLVMAFIAGRLVNQYGLRFGLLAGPIGVGAGVMAIVVVGLSNGIESSALFWVTIITFGLHMVLEEGFTIPAQKTSYQLLPKDERVATETMVEGIGMAVAVGISGLILLAFNAVSNLTVIDAAWLAFVITIVWMGVAVYLSRDYARLLLNKLNRRVLDEGSATLSNGFDQTLIKDFMQSGELGKVRLALNVLENRYEPSLRNHVLELIEDPKPEIRIEALKRIEQLQLHAAIPHINRRLNAESKPEVTGAALRTLGAVGAVGEEGITGGSSTTEQLIKFVDSASPQIQQGAIIGLLKHGNIPGKAIANERLMKLAQGTNGDSRALAARIIGDAGLPEHYQPLKMLLKDSQMTTRHDALRAAARLKHPNLLPDLLDGLSQNPAGYSAISRSLGQYGTDLLPTIARALNQTSGEQLSNNGEPLSTEPLSIETTCRLVQICGQIKGDDVSRLLQHHLTHPHPAVQRHVLTALNVCGYQAQTTSQCQEIEGVLQQLVARGLYILAVKRDIGQSDSATLLNGALNDEFIEVRQQVFYLLSFLYEPRAMRRAEEQISYGPPAVRAFATEMLDVTLIAQHKNMIWPLINDKIRKVRSLEQVTTQAIMQQLPREERLRELLKGSSFGGISLGQAVWLQTCTLFLIGREHITEQHQSIQPFLTSPDAAQRETAQWADHCLQYSMYQGQHQGAAGQTVLTQLPPNEIGYRHLDSATTDHAQMDDDGVYKGPVSKKYRTAKNMYLTLEKVALLKDVDIFAQTPDHILASVAAIVEQIDLDVNETFIQQGDIGDCMYLVIDGEVLIHQDEDEIFTLGPGKSVGELAILDLSPREASVTTTQPTQLFRIDKDAFDEVLDERPEIARSVIRALSQRVRMTTAARQSGEE